jgi:polar amino acid transport system substrate-binding protein
MKKLVILLILAAAIWGCSQKEQTAIERIRSTGVLKIGTDATYPPFEFNDEATGQLVGFDIDLMQAICQNLKLKPEFIVVPFGGIIPGLRSGKYDCIISAMTITEERERAVDFSLPYYDAGQTIAVPLNDTSIHSIDDLKGMKVGVQLGTTGEIMAKTIEGAEVISFNNIGAAFIDMENGHIDAVLNDAPTSMRAIKVRGMAKMVGPMLSTEQYGIAVDKSNGLLLDLINESLKGLIDGGTVDSLKSYWVGG